MTKNEILLAVVREFVIESIDCYHPEKQRIIRIALQTVITKIDTLSRARVVEGEVWHRQIGTGPNAMRYSGVHCDSVIDKPAGHRVHVVIPKDMEKGQ
jgi:hypothetical protein